MARYSTQRYVPSTSLSPYKAIMNSKGVQADLLARAGRVAASARAEGLDCSADVRPGEKRAHARATAATERAADYRGHFHNAKVDRVLMAALDRARG